jgi:hypothetical protein
MERRGQLLRAEKSMRKALTVYKMTEEVLPGVRSTARILPPGCNLLPSALRRIPHHARACLGKRRDVVQHRPEMAGAARNYEEVPQLVEPEHSGHQVRSSQPVDDRTHTVD